MVLVLSILKISNMDTSETELEKIIVDWLRDHNGYEQATPHDYNKDFALEDSWGEYFVSETQSDKVNSSMCFASPSERQKFFTRLTNEITKRGVVDVLRKGYKFNGSTFYLYYPLTSDLNLSAKAAYVAAMLEEKTEFVQTYFGNPDFQNFVNARVYQAAVNRLGN